MTLTELLQRFREMERNHGWIPEHKERIEQFLRDMHTNIIEGAIAVVPRDEEMTLEMINNGFALKTHILKNLEGLKS